MNFKRIKAQGKMWEYIWEPIILFLVSILGTAFCVWRKVWHDEDHEMVCVGILFVCFYFKYKNHRLNPMA